MPRMPRLPFVARARHTHAYVRSRVARRTYGILARGSLLRIPEIITRVTESKVKYYRLRGQTLYPRFCSLSAAMNIARRVLAERTTCVRRFPTAPRALGRPASIVKACLFFSIGNRGGQYFRGIYTCHCLDSNK